MNKANQGALGNVCVCYNRISGVYLRTTIYFVGKQKTCLASYLSRQTAKFQKMLAGLEIGNNVLFRINVAPVSEIQLIITDVLLL
jgi:hypothetical protein